MSPTHGASIKCAALVVRTRSMLCALHHLMTHTSNSTIYQRIENKQRWSAESTWSVIILLPGSFWSISSPSYVDINYYVSTKSRFNLSNLSFQEFISSQSILCFERKEEFLRGSRRVRFKAIVILSQNWCQEWPFSRLIFQLVHHVILVGLLNHEHVLTVCSVCSVAFVTTVIHWITVVTYKHCSTDQGHEICGWLRSNLVIGT